MEWKGQYGWNGKVCMSEMESLVWVESKGWYGLNGKVGMGGMERLV